MPELKFEVVELRFSLDEKTQQRLASVCGYLRFGERQTWTSISLKKLDDGRWQTVVFSQRQPAILKTISDEIGQKLAQHCANLLTTQNMWFAKATAQGTDILFKYGRLPDEALDRLTLSYRALALNLPDTGWNALWNKILDRARGDEDFAIRGYTKEETLVGLKNLREVFPPSWVWARFRDAKLSRMGEYLGPESPGWFPAYHLARTALGACCVDPGWSYLIEIGLAIETLRDFNGLRRLRDRLCKSEGTQHHLCLAADLHLRQKLVGLEPATGAGSSKNDLLVVAASEVFQVEVKELVSSTTAQKILSELKRKHARSPLRPVDPIVFHVVLRGAENPDPRREINLGEELRKLETEFPPSISAVVIGRRFHDSAGGRAKRDIAATITNSAASNPIAPAALLEAFTPNYETFEEPMLSFGSAMVFQNKPQSPENPATLQQP